jgi:hypothetical protein
MKNFNQLVNESSGLKLTRDYSRFLLEQQAFVAQKTCAILFGEETDYDGSDDTSNDPPFNSHLSGQFYAHINVDGARKVRVFNSAQEAALAIQKYPGSMIYNFKGDEVDPNQVTESVERFNIFEDEASDFTQRELKKRSPEAEGGILDSIANAWRAKDKGAAVAMANNNSFIARNLQNLQNALTGAGVFGADRTPEQTMQQRDAEVKKLRDKLDAYEMEQRGKGFRKVEDIPLSDEETKDVQTFIKQRQEQQDRVGPMMPGVAERVSGLPREQLKAYKDFYKTATEYQGKSLQDYYNQNPDKYSAHEPYMDTKTAIALKPISRSEDEGSAMPGRLKGTSFDSAAKVVAGLPETAAMVAAGIVAPELVGALVGGAGRIVPAIARVSSGAAAKAATAQAINTAVGIAGVDKLANAKDVVQGAEGAVMAAAIADPLFKSTSPNPAAHKNAIDLWNAKLKAELTRTLAGQKGAYETSAMIRREVPTGAKEGGKRTGPRGEYPKVAETQPTTEWPGVSTNPRTIETGGKASETAGQVANEEIPLLLRNLETRAWRDYETFDPAVVRQAARDRVAGRLGSGQPEVSGTRPSVPSENPPAARETVPFRVTDTGTYKEREKERTKAENKEKERIETEMRKGRVNPEQTSSRPSFADTVDALTGTIQKAGTELVNWMKPKPGTSVQRRALTPSSERALYPKRTASEVLADTKYATEKPLGVLRQAAKDISTGVKERGAAETAAQVAAVAPQVVSTVIPDMPTPPAIRAPAPDVWKPTRNMDLMVSEPAKAPRSNANTEPVSVTPKGEVIKVTPTPEPVDRKSIDSFVKSLLPSAANRTASTQPTTNVPPPTASPSTPSDTPTTTVPSTVTDTTTAPTTVPSPATSTTTAPSTSTAPVTAPTVAPTIAPTVTPEVAPVTNPIVNNIVQTLIAAAAIGGGSKLLPGKKGGGGGGGGGGAGGRIGSDPAEREELKRQKQETDAQAKNWDLMMKNIWGKNVETLTK